MILLLYSSHTRSSLKLNSEKKLYYPRQPMSEVSLKYADFLDTSIFWGQFRHSQLPYKLRYQKTLYFKTLTDPKLTGVRSFVQIHEEL